MPWTSPAWGFPVCGLLTKPGWSGERMDGKEAAQGVVWCCTVWSMASFVTLDSYWSERVTDGLQSTFELVPGVLTVCSA